MQSIILEKNLRCLEMNSPEAARAARAASSEPAGVEFFTARSGALSAKYAAPDGRTTLLHSAYDPEHEARRLLGQSNTIVFGKWIVALGPGLWYFVRTLQKTMFHCPICVIEASPALLRAVMERIPLEDILLNPGLRVVTGSVDDMKRQLADKPVRAGSPQNIMPLHASEIMNAREYLEMRGFVEQMSVASGQPADPSNAVRREVFGHGDPGNFRMVITANDRYSCAVTDVLSPCGADARSMFTFQSTESILEFKPTCIFAFTTILLNWPDLLGMLKFLKSREIPIIVWNMEDPRFFHSPEKTSLLMECLELSDLFFTQTAQYIGRYGRRAGRVRYLPTGARPDMFGEPLPESELKLDYSFFGLLSAERVEFFREITSRLGPLKGRIVTPGMAPEDFGDMIRRTKVNLTAFTMCDLDNEPQWALSDRVWEIPYSGGFLLQDNRGHAKDHFAPDETAVFSDAADCAEKIIYYVSHPKERQRIMLAARARVRRDHLWAYRIEEILKTFFREIAGNGKRYESVTIV